MEIDVLQAPLGGVQGTAPTRWKPLGEGGRGAWAARTPLLAPGGPWTKEPAREACRLQPGRALWRAGSSEASLELTGTVSLWGCGWGRPWSSTPCLPAEASGWAPAAPWVCSCPPAGPIWAGRGPACQVGPALHGGPTPFLSSATRAFGQPLPARPGAACRSSSSEGSVLSRGPWRDECGWQQSWLDMRVQGGAHPPRQLCQPPKEAGMCLGRGCWWSPGAHLWSAGI